MQEFNQAWVLSKMRVEITELPKWRYITVKTWVNTLESLSVRALEMYVNGKKIRLHDFWAVLIRKNGVQKH
jgi:hypothetical protein